MAAITTTWWLCVDGQPLVKPKKNVKEKAAVNAKADLDSLEIMCLDLKLRHIGEKWLHDDQRQAIAHHGPVMTMLRLSHTQIRSEVGAELELSGRKEGVASIMTETNESIYETISNNGGHDV